jgi:hypothetical protein
MQFYKQFIEYVTYAQVTFARITGISPKAYSSA